MTTDKGKKTEIKPTRREGHAAEGSGHPGRPGTPAEQGAGRHAGKLAYRNDPSYLKLLGHFQSAEWDKCQDCIDLLLQSHPGDKHLLGFRQDVQMRSEQQQHSERQTKSEDRKERRKARIRLTVAVAAVVVLGLSGTLLVNAFRVDQARQQASAAATQTAQALAAKHDVADTLLRAGMSEQALAAYVEIQQVDPSYAGIAQDIKAAQLAVRTEELYQQARQAMDNGDNPTALELLGEVQTSSPEYKDTSQLVDTLTRQQQIARLLDNLHAAYDAGDSQGVVDAYEQIQVIDPYLDLPELDDELFASYKDLVLRLAALPNPTLGQIQDAASYYRRALALFPQSISYARERAELQEVAVELVATQYYLQGISLLDSSDYSIEGLQQSILVLQRAREKAPDSVVVDAAIEKSQLFIDSYDRLVHGDWDDAIKGLEQIYSRDPEFAGGRVRYFLYEAYTTRGDLLMLNADFGGAFKDFQAAEKFAWEDESNTLRIFQIEIRLGESLRKMRQYDQSAEFYRYAFQQVAGQPNLAAPEQAKLRQTLEQAEAAYVAGNRLAAVDLYAEAAELADKIPELTRVNARRGDTLPNIAFETGSTLVSLRGANDLGESLILSRSMPLMVPTLAPITP